MKRTPKLNESSAFLSSDRQITFYGCKGVEKYSEKEIVLQLVDVSVTVLGEMLSLSTFASDEISVTGAINAINIHREGEKC